MASAAPPALKSPWDKLDLKAKPEVLYKKLGATKPADNVCENGERVVDGVCFTIEETLGTKHAMLYFASSELAKKKLTNAWGAPRS